MRYEIVTNTDCNLRCKYCYMGEHTIKVNTAEFCRNFLRACFKRDFGSRSDYSRDVGPGLFLVGGEEFLHVDLLDAILSEHEKLNREYGFKRYLRIIFTTNGTQMKRPEVQDFLHKWKDHVCVCFSIDGVRVSHDCCRVYPDGRGSYDDVIEGYHITRGIIGNNHCIAKPTFSSATKRYYSEGVIQLLKEGFVRMNANFICETPFPKSSSEEVYQMFVPIIDYIMAHRLWNKVSLKQLRVSEAFNGPLKNHSSCGAGHGVTLGFDGKLYLCHREASADSGYSFAHLVGENIVFDDKLFHSSCAQLWRERPQLCRECDVGALCNTCVSAVLRHKEGAIDFYEAFPPCGWIEGTLSAKREYISRIAQAETPQ